jgi:hypothetical protein
VIGDWQTIRQQQNDRCHARDYFPRHLYRDKNGTKVFIVWKNGKIPIRQTIRQQENGRANARDYFPPHLYWDKIDTKVFLVWKIGKTLI